MEWKKHSGSLRSVVVKKCKIAQNGHTHSTFYLKILAALRVADKMFVQVNQTCIQHLLSVALCHQCVTSWLSGWLPCSVLLTAPRSVLSSPSAMPWRSLTYRPAGNTRRWTTRTPSSSTCFPSTPPSPGPSWTWWLSSNGGSWLWSTRTARVGNCLESVRLPSWLSKLFEQNWFVKTHNGR